MRLKDMKDRKIVVWGTGREGLAAARMILERLPDAALTFIDEKETPPIVLKNIARAEETQEERYFPVLSGEAIGSVLGAADIVVKSPGVSLYHPLLQGKNAFVLTSLLNIWMAENEGAFVIGVTGTKGKSTTASLLGHVLNALGKRAVVLGNIGAPVSEAKRGEADYFILETSSYQAANFSGRCRIGVLTSLFPEHLNWHGTEAAYYRDKARLLQNSDTRIVSAAAFDILKAQGIELGDALVFDSCAQSALKNDFLSRPHNQGNVCAVLRVLETLGFELPPALATMEPYQGLPHRQQEIGQRDGILFVDDSLSTTPQSALAALAAYAAHPVSLIAGGFDRGLDYESFAEALAKTKNIKIVVCMGPSGKRLFAALKKKETKAVFVSSMEEAVEAAQEALPCGGAVLLSPASPSFDMFKDYNEKARNFMEACGLSHVSS